MNTIEKLENRIDELEKLVNHDILTSLPNKLLFKNLLNKSVANASRNNYIVSVVLLSLDRFQDITDTYGHLIGDELILKISKRLLKRVREGDLVAHIAYDEFAIILEHIYDEDVIAQVVNTILKTISKPCELSNGAVVCIEACAGISVTPKDSKDTKSLLEFAENSLVQAKQDGHGLYRFYTDDMTQKSMQKIAYKEAIIDAINSDKLYLYYQPKVDINSGEITGAEALVRWKCTTYGDVPPDIFIPIAQETGVIHLVGEWVINRAFNQGKMWLDSGYKIPISINISSKQIAHHDIASTISKALKSSNFDANYLELEIKEDIFIQKKEAVDSLQKLRKLGVRVSIDNFGTGFSSLADLKSLPIDGVKIGRFFIDTITEDKNDAQLVAAIIKMCNALNLKATAVGVEEQEQLDFLKESGCDIYQGHIKSKALSVKQFEKLLIKQSH